MPMRKRHEPNRNKRASHSRAEYIFFSCCCNNDTVDYIRRAFAIFIFLTGRLLYRHVCVRANEIAVAIVRGGVDAGVRKV